MADAEDAGFVEGAGEDGEEEDGEGGPEVDPL